MNPPDAKDDPDGAAAHAGPHFWWVNHGQTYRQELDGEYLWSPKRRHSGARNISYDNILRVMPGDVVFSCVEGAIRALGVALGRAREAPKPWAPGAPGAQAPANRPKPGRYKPYRRNPDGHNPDGHNPDGHNPEEGWQVAVRFQELPTPLALKDPVVQPGSVRPGRRSPRTDPQSVLLSAIPPALACELRQLLGAQLERTVAAITLTCGGRLVEDAAEEAIQQRTDIDPIAKKTLLGARHGQGVYRVNVEQVELQCRVTGLLDRRHLRARHIKPWCVCDDRQKLDGFNGLLLSPHVDHLFLRGYISFADSGELLLSADLNPAVLESWGIALPRKAQAFTPAQCWYLAYHREQVFEKPDGGRRRQGESWHEPELDVSGEPAIIHPLAGGVSDS